MAENFIANPGAGGDTFAADDILGVKFPRVKLVLGADNANDGDVASGNPVPVSAASLPLPTGASTEATLALIKAKTDNLDVALSTRTKPADTQIVSAASLPLPTGAATSALQTQPGVDIGDVTVNNAAGAAAVNVQDGGNSLTVDGSVTAMAAIVSR